MDAAWAGLFGYFSSVIGLRLTTARRISVGVVAIVCCALAAAAVEQHKVGWNEYSHFAQVRAFAHGTPIIDRYRHTTGDRAIFHGHDYSDKAPGMAFLLTPVYRVAASSGIVKPGGLGMIHLLAVFGSTLPFAIILLLAYRLVERRDPGNGTAAAVMLGLGTILLPFATMLFSHVLSACLGFAAFYLLWRERQRGGGLGLIAAAGVLVGYAVSTEYPLAILGALLGLLVAWRQEPVKPVLTYGAGVAVGLVPLLLYDWWAFGSPLHLSYQSVAANSSGVVGLTGPSLWRAVELLISGRGLLVVTPVCAAAIAGMVILYREGRRTEALIPAVVCAAYFAYNVCYYLPFGGAVPGPRFLITMLPFLAVPLSAAYRRAPLATLSLAIISAATMATATITLPILSTRWPTSTWWKLLGKGSFSTHGLNVELCAVFLALGILAAARATPRPRVTRLDLELTVLGLATWLAVARAAPRLLAHDIAAHQTLALGALIVVGVAVTVVIAYVARGKELVLLAGLPLVALAMRRFDHTTLAFSLAAISLALVFTLVRVARPRRVAL